MNIRIIPRLGGRLIAALAMTAGVICAGPAGAATFAYAINYQGEPMTCGHFGNLGVCSFSQLIQPVSAIAGDQFHISVSSTAPVTVPGSNIGNGFFVSAYDADLKPGGVSGGPVRSDWTLVGQGVQTTANVPPFGMSQGNQSNWPNDYIGFLSYGGTYGIPNNGFSVTGLDALLTVVTADPLPTVGVAFGYYWFTDQTAAVPEPAAWATLILGFSLAGTALRRRRTALA